MKVIATLCFLATAAVAERKPEDLRATLQEMIDTVNSGRWPEGSRMPRASDSSSGSGGKPDMCPIAGKPFDAWLASRHKDVPLDHTCTPDDLLSSYGPDCNCDSCTGRAAKTVSKVVKPASEPPAAASFSVSLEEAVESGDAASEEGMEREKRSIVYDERWKPAADKQKKRQVSKADSAKAAPAEAEGSTESPKRPPLSCRREGHPKARGGLDEMANEGVRKQMEAMGRFETHPSHGLLQAVADLDMRGPRPDDEL